MGLKKQTDYILWLPSWYPSELDVSNGDFIQRHAIAVAEFVPVHVFYIIRGKKYDNTNAVRVIENKYENRIETIVYYSIPDLPFKFAEQILSFLKYTWLYKKYIQKIFSEKGFPLLVHVHIIYKAGLIAKWVYKKWNIPYVLTEQWTIHLPEAKPNYSDLSRIEKYLFSGIMKTAAVILPVSNYLAIAMKSRWPEKEYIVIPNTVDAKSFYPIEKERNDHLKLIHISTLSFQKDPENLFKALDIFKKEDIKFSMDVFGNIEEPIRKLVNDLGLKNEIVLHGEVSHLQLVSYLQSSDALILYSRYETFGCVIIEANACGIPAIVTDTKLMRELISENINGILVSPNSHQSLAKAISEFALEKEKYDFGKIVETVKKYSYQKVGEMYFSIYKRYFTSK